MKTRSIFTLALCCVLATATAHAAESTASGTYVKQKKKNASATGPAKKDVGKSPQVAAPKAAGVEGTARQAAKAKVQSAGVVLLPVQGSGIAIVDREQYRSALANALGEKYRVFSGSEVDKKLRTYATKTCDAEKCLLEITSDYQVSLVGRAMISRESEGYTVTVEVVDIYSDNRSELSDTRSCRRCNKAGVIALLKSMVTGRPIETTAEDAAELAAWKTAQQQDSLEGYGAFLASYPDGPHSTTARAGFATHAQKLSAGERNNLTSDWLAKSRLHFVAKQFDDVVRVSRTHLELEPREESALLNLSSALYMLQRFDEADIAAKQLLATNSSHAGAFNMLGAIREQEGERELALQQFEKGCQLKSEASCKNMQRIQNAGKS